MPLSRDQGEALARMLTSLRPESWDYAGTFAAVKKLAHRPETPGQLIAAAVRAAEDPNVRTPGVIPSAGSHWDTGATIPKPPRLTPEHECSSHPGQWAATCSLCAGERLAPTAWTDLEQRDPDTATPEPVFDPSSPTIGDAMRKEARRIARQAAIAAAQAKPAKPPTDGVE